jgi:hypothetical protein
MKNDCDPKCYERNARTQKMRKKKNLQDMKGISKLSSLHIIKHSRQNKCLTPMENEAVLYNINKICDISFFPYVWLHIL